MIPILFLGLAALIPIAGLAVLTLIGRIRADRWEDGIKDFQQRRQAFGSNSRRTRRGNRSGS